MFAAGRHTCRYEGHRWFIHSALFRRTCPRKPRRRFGFPGGGVVHCSLDPSSWVTGREVQRIRGGLMSRDQRDRSLARRGSRAERASSRCPGAPAHPDRATDGDSHADGHRVTDTDDHPDAERRPRHRRGRGRRPRRVPRASGPRRSPTSPRRTSPSHRSCSSTPSTRDSAASVRSPRLYQENGVVSRGEPALSPEVTSVELDGEPSALVTDCVDVTTWQPVYEATGESGSCTRAADASGVRGPGDLLRRPVGHP